MIAMFIISLVVFIIAAGEISGHLRQISLSLKKMSGRHYMDGDD
jgi:hypothetical protein